jgi:hypothetical protein
MCIELFESASYIKGLRGVGDFGAEEDISA